MRWRRELELKIVSVDMLDGEAVIAFSDDTLSTYTAKELAELHLERETSEPERLA